MTKQASDTREKILKTACHLFAENGYRATTIAAICQTAGANIAAVNYHFVSKENLYQKAWQYAHKMVHDRVPHDGGVSEDAPPEARLRGQISAGLQRAMLGEALEFRIVRGEMANPTGLLKQVIEEAIAPLRKATRRALQELLGPKATQKDIKLCEVFVISPWMHLTHRIEAEKHEGLAPVFAEEDLDYMTDHFTAFALAGIREFAERINAR